MHGISVMYRCYLFSVYWPREIILRTLNFRSIITQSSSNVTADMKPFDEIPGPIDFPFFGTYFLYKFGELIGLHINLLTININFITFQLFSYGNVFEYGYLYRMRNMLSIVVIILASTVAIF